MNNVKRNQVVRSALWAAYGDALGFPTELVSEKEFSKRNGRLSVSEPIDWKRRIGGLFGPEVPFLAGSYSDDTQMRLCTSRAIRGDGYFDVESFAKIELPVWLNYALGAGRGSKAAATNLSLKESTWSQNFFQGNSNYIDGGGNGAAMRIQPHVWANHQSGSAAFMSDVVRNTICTHGHPRAIIGAAIHAMGIFQCMETNAALGPNDWAGLGETAAVLAYEALVDDEELSLVWVPNWENRAKKKLSEIWANTVLEWHDSVQRALDICENVDNPETAYRTCIAELGGFTNEERGSGLKTSLYAIILSWLFKADGPSVGLAVAANCFNSDTDTIATMAGALMGINYSEPPSSGIQDFDYIQKEAIRLYLVGCGEKQKSFAYPDLLRWSPPRNQSDAWRSVGNDQMMMALGRLEPFGQSFDSKRGADITWQWCMLPFGQTILAKHRKNMSTVQSAALLKEKDLLTDLRQENKVNDKSHNSQELVELPTLDSLTKKSINSGFAPEVVGAALLELANGPMAIEHAIAFAAIIAKAKIARKS